MPKLDDKIVQELEQEDPTDFHTALLVHCRSLIEMSRTKMCSFYDKWDTHDEVYRGERKEDASDQKAEKRGEPVKMVIPLTYSQVQAFISFCFALYYQREHLLEMVGTGEEDHKAAKIAEALINRDLRENIFESKLYQFLLDCSRFGLGVWETGWVRETAIEEQVVQDAQELLGQMFAGETTASVEVTRFLGNRISSVSPYKFFPDIRLPLGDFQKGEFCGSEDEVSMVSLRQMEIDGEIAGLEHVKALTEKDLENRTVRLNHIKVTSTLRSDSKQSQGTVLITKCQVQLIPSKFELDGGELMGDSTRPELWNVWYANDKRIIKAQPLGYNHGKFTYHVGEFSPDMHRTVNEGLSGSISQLQATITWLINSHITSVRKSIQNQLVVDTSAVEIKDLQERRPVIRLKPAAQGQQVDRFVQQLKVTDVTSGHIGDANQLHDMVQVVTGINDNALGQFNSGRRSATEARAVNSSAAGRLKLTATLIFRTAIEPMARQMNSNHRQGLDEETFVKVLGQVNDANDYGAFKGITKKDLIGSYDFEVFDSTIPSERSLQANQLQELLVAIMQNPMLIPMLGYDPRLLLKEILELRGIRNPERFKVPELRQQELLNMAMIGADNGQGAGINGDQAGANGAPNIAALAGMVGAGGGGASPANNGTNSGGNGRF